MQPLSNRMLLALWERGQDRSPVERALLLLEAALPAIAEDDRIGIDIGVRDAALLKLRHATFGTRISGCVACPQCGSRLEFDLDTGAIVRDFPEPVESTIAFGDELRFRLPNSSDLLAVARCADADSAAREILNRCCLTARRPQEWSEGAIAEVGALMAETTGATDIRLGFTCAACGRAFSEHLDMPDYFWGEIEHRAQHILDDVHCLASAYGWDEESVLALTPARRAAYLARCGA
jgi:hypothetical protein